MLDYHLHLWPHSEHETPLRPEQLAEYCARAQAAGVTELAVTEHLFRFRQADALLGGFWNDERVSPALAENMAGYYAFHATADLDAYVACAQEAKEAGLPIVIGLEVDYYEGRMDDVAGLLAGYPFDVLLGSVHWVDGWRFDDIDDPASMAEWSVRQVDGCWEAYTEALEELAASGACDVLAHPDLIKVAGYVPDGAGRVVGSHRGGRGGLGHGGGGQLGRLAQTRGRAVSGAGPARAFRRSRRAADHGVGCAPARARGRSGRRPAGRARCGGCLRPAGVQGPRRVHGAGGGPRRGGGLMPTPAELALSHTDLKPEELEHLQRLLGSWSVLADLSFSDLLLLVPVHAAGINGTANLGADAVAEADPSQEDPELVVLGQMRPNNRPTLVDQDLVGQTVNESQWTLVAQCLHSGEIVRGSIHHPILGEQVPVENIPVRFEGHIIGALLRVSLAPLKGPTSMYERTYLDVFERLADMVAQSAFPFPDEDVGTEESPRVGDGVVVVDADGRVEFASPNAMNAFHRMGIYTQPEGRRFGDLDVEESAVEWALATGRPVVEEVERRPDVIVLVHCIPLLSHGVVTGAMILLRDVTDVRRLDRLLLSKDAAIREVHHRVKNNLQTISSLLSLQARRVGDRAARVALHEAERRVRSIALVHEILSRDPSDQVPFAEIVSSLVQMAEDSVVSSQPIVISVHGDLGEVAADVATPLAVTVAELLQNAVEHAFDPENAGVQDGAVGLEGAGGGAGDAPVGHVELTMSSDESELRVEVRDDGLGLPEGFDIEKTSSLGLSIVRDLVVSQLEGTISMQPVPVADGGGTRVAISVPVRAPR